MMIQTVGTTLPASGARGGAFSARPDAATLLVPAAKQLGLSLGDLQQHLRGGTSLDDIAAKIGVSHDDLIVALKEGIAAAKPQGAPDITGTDRLDRMAQGLASSPGARMHAPPPPPEGGRGPKPPHGTDQSDGSALTNVAALLKMSTDDLVSSLLNGSSLKDLASAKGVPAQAILDAAKRGLALDTTM